ncbi:hypothetical protein F4777DRAFT_226451 [Nemania sp. FL0916]|nr:hypothetical protein F4777DRAFT_226451 [Nemania sp. FL0916]
MVAYHPVPHSLEEDLPKEQKHRFVLRILLSLALLLLISVAILIPLLTSRLGGQDSFPPASHSNSAQLPDDVVHSILVEFSYNRTFGSDPWLNDASDAAWNSMVPLGQGTVRYPRHSSQVYTLSVVHQLHCLWSIYHNYYDGRRPDASPPGEDVQSHMRHCFDYLRQSLLCAADATLEPVDIDLGGVTGWSTPHTCRNYREVAEWAEEHRANNMRGFH